MAHQGWPDPKAPWERGSHADWATPVTDENWVRRVNGDYIDWIKVLECPRCGHQMSLTVGPGALRDARAAGEHAGQVAAFCNCEPKHEGRPEKRPRGCGYNAWIPGPVAESVR
jgi:hypothetical protein